jgi:hypothetical protein
MAMPLHEIAFVVSGLLVIPLALIQLTMRRQVHDANYGSPEISPWDVRFVNSMFGQHGIWILHKRTFQRSALRSWCMALCIAWLVSVMVAIISLVLAHR